MRRRDVWWLVLVAAWGCGPSGGSAPGEVASATSAAPLGDAAPPAKVAPAAGAATDGLAHLFVGPTSEHACASDRAGTLRCWGRNDAGQIGRVDAETSHVPRAVALDAPVVEAALGQRHTCALLATGKVRCFGEDASGPRDARVDVGDLEGVEHLVAGADFTCAQVRDGSVACFGRAPGNAGTTRDAVVLEGVRARAIAASTRALCALQAGEGAERDRVVCLGDNPEGALVPGGPRRLVEPTATPDLEGPLDAITMSDDGLCGLGAAARVVCRGAGPSWNGTAMFATQRVAYAADGYGCGLDARGISCRHATEVSTTLADVEGAFREVGVGHGFACGLPKGPGPVVCWGNNAYGALGASPPRPRATPFVVERLRGATRIAAGDASVCGLVGRSIRCFGDHDRKARWGSGRVGDDRADEIAVADDLAVGGGIRCGLTQGLASCWGDNGASGIITENPGRIESPTTLASLGKWKQLSFGMTHACGLGEDRVVRCWGGVGRQRRPPAEVRGVGEVAALDAGGSEVCALLADGGVSCAPFEGQRALAPARVAGVRGLVALAVGGRHACGIDVAGAVRCWGSNEQGQLGRTDVGATEVVVVDGLPKALAVAAGDDFTCALSDDGRVRCWGASGEGQLGRADGPRAPVDGLGPIAAITAGERHACALQKDGAVWCWGDRRFGRFFAKDVPSSTEPLPVVAPADAASGDAR